MVFNSWHDTIMWRNVRKTNVVDYVDRVEFEDNIIYKLQDTQETLFKVGLIHNSKTHF